MRINQQTVKQSNTSSIWHYHGQMVKLSTHPNSSQTNQQLTEEQVRALTARENIQASQLPRYF